MDVSCEFFAFPVTTSEAVIVHSHPFLHACLILRLFLVQYILFCQLSVHPGRSGGVCRTSRCAAFFFLRTGEKLLSSDIFLRHPLIPHWFPLQGGFAEREEGKENHLLLKKHELNSFLFFLHWLSYSQLITASAPSFFLLSLWSPIMHCHPLLITLHTVTLACWNLLTTEISKHAVFLINVDWI